MESLPPILPMYTHHLPTDTGKLLLTCQARKSPEGEATLTLYEKCLLETVAKRRQVMLYDFDLRYEFTVNPPSITFEKDLDSKRKEERKSDKVKFFL